MLTDSLIARFQKWRRQFCFCLMMAALHLCGLFLSTAWAKCPQDQFEVGQTVKVEFLGEEQFGTIEEINGNGWLWVNLKRNGRETRHLFPPRRVLGSNPASAAKGSESTSEPLREWTDKSGKFKTNAAFVALKNDAVVLKKENGDTIEVALDKLCDEDAQLARTLSLGPAPSDNPFESPSNSEGSESKATPELFQVTPFDFKKEKTIKETKATWKLSPPENGPANAVLSPEFSAGMTVKSSHSGNVLFDIRDPAWTVSTFFDLRSSQAFAYLNDLANDQSIGPYVIPRQNASILAFDAVNRQILTTGTVSGPAVNDIWRLGPEAGQIDHVLSFDSHAPGTGVKLQAQHALFVDENRVCLLEFSQLKIFDWKNRVSLYTYSFDTTSRPMFSLDQKFVFGTRDGQVVAVDLLAAKQIARSPVRIETFTTFDISRDLKKIATYSGDYLKVFDLETGKLLDSANFPGFSQDRPYFLDDGFLLISGQRGGVLVNLPLRSPIWQFQSCTLDLNAAYPGLVWMSSGSSGNYRTEITTLPSEAARDAIAGLTLEDITLLKAGDSLSVELSAAGPGAASITKQLQDIGYKIVLNSPWQLKATILKPNSQTVEYQDFGRPFAETEKVTVTSQRFELVLTHNGEKVWSKSGGYNNDPGNFVRLEAGQSVQQLASQRTRNPVNFFASVQIPDIFIKLPPSGYYGITTGR